MNVPDTFFSLHEELVLFFLSVIFGAVIGVAYDVLRVFRLVFPHNTLLTAIEDLVFLSLCGTLCISSLSAVSCLVHCVSFWDLSRRF